MRLRISSRRSDLARIQAHDVAQALRTADPTLEIEFHFSESLGDKNLSDPLWKMPEKGVFTTDLTAELTEGRTDLVVHSWKDLPVETNPETEIAATLPRADARDLLLFKKTSTRRLSAAAPVNIFSSSPRREYNLKPFLRDHLPFQPRDVRFQPVRGNIPTRLGKLLSSDGVDGLIVAKAALDRILSATAEEFAEASVAVRDALSACDFMLLPLTVNPAAAAQGALAIEIRRDRADLRALLAKIHHGETFREANEERAVLKSHGGGCHQKIGVTVLEREDARLFFLRGLTDDGRELRDCRRSGGVEGPVSAVRSDLLFERIRRPGPFDPGPANALFVASAFSWPGNLDFAGILWTAGLPTWKKLAAQGLWISGSAESLGEREDPRLERIFPDAVWATLSHGGARTGERGPVLATYDLRPKDAAAPPEGETLYWTSGFVFDEALKRWPQLANRRHVSGPGKTADHLRARLGKAELRWPLGEGT